MKYMFKKNHVVEESHIQNYFINCTQANGFAPTIGVGRKNLLAGCNRSMFPTSRIPPWPIIGPIKSQYACCLGSSIVAILVKLQNFSLQRVKSTIKFNKRLYTLLKITYVATFCILKSETKVEFFIRQQETAETSCFIVFLIPLKFKTYFLLSQQFENGQQICPCSDVHFGCIYFWSTGITCFQPMKLIFRLISFLENFSK